MELTIILFIVLFHELGHYLVARLFDWRIKQIMLWVFGGVMETDEHGTRPIREEVLVTIAGPMQNVVIYMILYVLSNLNLVPASIIELAWYYNTAIIMFNLLPIWPLDGGKLLFLFLASYLPYKKAYHTTIISSMIITVLLLLLQLIFFPFTLSTFLLMIFLFSENRSDWKQRYYVFIRFLLKRYEGNAVVKIVQPIHVSNNHVLMDVFEQFRQEKKHPVYVSFPERKRITMDENECLRSYFHDLQYDKTIGEILNQSLLDKFL